MTIEEKVKAYDEVIERAKIYYSTTDSVADIELIELLFPEFKDSEDERIRKSIIEHFAGSHSSMYPYKGFTKEQIIAWLEKQSASWKNEQNTWSEEDEKMLNKTITLLNEFGGDRDAGFYTLQEMDCRNCADWLKSLENRVQHKAEWSKEDSMHLTNAILAAEKEWGIESCTSKWLKSLRPQSRREWSEKDRIHYIRCLQYLESISPRKEDFEWFKSLCPQDRWKPSDEQMNIFKGILDYHGHNFSTKGLEVMKSIFENLKKLKE